MNLFKSDTIVDVQGILRDTFHFDNDFSYITKEASDDGACEPASHYLGNVRNMHLAWSSKQQYIYVYDVYPSDLVDPARNYASYVYFDYSEKKYQVFSVGYSGDSIVATDYFSTALKNDYLKLVHKEFLGHFIHDMELQRHQQRIISAYMTAFAEAADGANLDHVCSRNFYEFSPTKPQIIKLKSGVKLRVNRKSRIYPDNGLTVSEISIWRASTVKLLVENGTTFEVQPSNLTFTDINVTANARTTHEIISDPKYDDMILNVFRTPQEFYDSGVFHHSLRSLTVDWETEIPGMPGTTD